MSTDFQHIITGATILRFRDGKSDKVWVMCPGLGFNGDHQVFWGATRWTGTVTGNLQSKSVNGNFRTRIDKKLKEGYDEWQDVSFDMTSQKVIHNQAKQIPQPQPKAKPDPNFWYRIDQSSPTEDISSILDDICLELGEYETESGTSGLVDQFNALSITADLRAGKVSGTSKYSESPMAALLLFALRRAYPTLVLVSDDDNDSVS